MTQQDQRAALLPADADGVLSPGDLNPDSRAFALLQGHFGFVPNHVVALARLPRLIEAELQISNAFLFRERALTRSQKELILLAVAVARENPYTAALSYQGLLSSRCGNDQLIRIVFDYRQAGLSESDVALIDFALALGRHPTWVTRADIEGLRKRGLEDEHILEAILTASWAGYLCILSAGLGVSPNFNPPDIPPAAVRGTVFRQPSPRDPQEPGGPYLRAVDLQPQFFPPFALVQKKWGFIPHLFQAQTQWPDLVEAELRAIDLWLNTGDVLSQRQKECIFLTISAANMNSYCVAAHCEVLRVLGVSEEEADQIALDHRHANLPEADKVLLDVCLKLAREPAQFGGADLQVLREQSFSEQQILEAVTIAAVTNFVNTLNAGLGVEPDFQRAIPLGKQKVHLFPAGGDLMDEKAGRLEAGQQDPDAACVARVRAGDAEAFEELVQRHGRRVYRTLAGMLRQTGDIEDAVQDTFVKAFRHMAKFEGRSRFSTWLTGIAVNTGLQRLRGHKELESLDERPGTLDEFRPRQVQAWQENPEQSYSKAEIRDMVWKGLAGLPLKYRIVVMLRDLQQLSTAETASALGLAIPAVKIRLFRGRLMLREALSPYFVRQATKRVHA